MTNSSVYALFLFLVLMGSGVLCDIVVMYESTAYMDLEWDNSTTAETPSTLPALYELEEYTADYLKALLSETVSLRQEGKNILSVSVSVTDEKQANETTTLKHVVKASYTSTSNQTDEKQSETPEPIQLDVLLQELVDQDAPAGGLIPLATLLNISNATSRTPLYMSFSPSQFSVVLSTIYTEFEEDDANDAERSPAELGLIIATCALSVMLIVVSSVLLYITGGWEACRQKISNCLFEEEELDDDDQYTVNKQSTFQVQSYDDEDRTNAEDESESAITGMATLPSGILGVQSMNAQSTPGGEMNNSVDYNPAAGMGIKTPMDGGYDTDYGEDSELDVTPMSTMGGPLGITSMRKMPKEDLEPDQSPSGGIQGGLSHMILQRLTNGSTANEPPSNVPPSNLMIQHNQYGSGNGRVDP